MSTSPRDHHELRRAVEASERERLRWARELHDETLQDLSALKLVLQTAREEDDPDRVHALLDEAIGRVDGQVEGLRGLITRLRPAALDRLGLAAGLEALAADTSWPALSIDIRVDLAYEAGRHPVRLLPDIELAVYRIVQEALANVARHAGARTATVTVEETADALVAEIADDGVGFDRAAVEAGFGLVGMEERAQLVGGTLEVRSAVGEGTRVRVTLPPHHRAASASA